MTLLTKEEVIEMKQENGVIDWNNFHTKLIVSIYENPATSQNKHFATLLAHYFAKLKTAPRWTKSRTDLHLASSLKTDATDIHPENE